MIPTINPTHVRSLCNKRQADSEVSCLIELWRMIVPAPILSPLAKVLAPLRLSCEADRRGSLSTVLVPVHKTGIFIRYPVWIRLDHALNSLLEC